MDLANVRMLIHKLLNKDPDIVPEEAPLIILDSNPDVCMSKNGNNTKHTRHAARRLHLVRNGENFKIHNTEWCEGGLQLADIATNNVDDNDLNPRIIYIMVRLEN